MWWTPEEDKLLGVLPDEEAVRGLNRPLKGVAGRRLKLRIPMLGVIPPRPWTRSEEAMLGTMSDRKLAKKLGRTVLAVAARRCRLRKPMLNSKRHNWTVEDKRLLGTR